MKIHLLIYLCLILFTHYSCKNTHFQLLSKDDEASQISFTSEGKGFVLQNLNNGTASLLTSPDNKKILSFNSYQTLDFKTPLTINTPSLDLVMKYAGSSLVYDGMDQWTMIRLDDFQGQAQGWSKEKMSVCGSNDNMFLGGHCNFGGEDVTKNFTDIPEHSMIRITANFHFFDKWEGEEAFMYLNGSPVWSDSYKWCDKVFIWKCKKYAINACGAEFPDRLAVPIDFSSKNKNLFLIYLILFILFKLLFNYFFQLLIKTPLLLSLSEHSIIKVLVMPHGELMMSQFISNKIMFYFMDMKLTKFYIIYYFFDLR